jgi:hypothetical protein
MKSFIKCNGWCRVRFEKKVSTVLDVGFHPR